MKDRRYWRPLVFIAVLIWINDHCVLFTLMVFCGIGKIEVNGELFKHMRDP
jgi:hypothetical protein